MLLKLLSCIGFAFFFSSHLFGVELFSSPTTLSAQDLEAGPSLSMQRDAEASSSEQRLDAILRSLSAWDAAWSHEHPHQGMLFLNWAGQQCEYFFPESTEKELGSVAMDPVLSQLVWACLMVESERINQVSPWTQWTISRQLDRLFSLLPQTQLSLKERLYAEGRVYSSLPAFYGQNQKKALISLEFLRRLESRSELSIPWIKRIRQNQGRAEVESETPGEAEEKTPAYFRRKENDGLGIGWVPSLYGSFPQGFGLQLRFQDSAIGDKARRLQSRVFATTRGSVGLEAKVEDFEWIPDSSAAMEFKFLHGIQDFHGLGIQSPRERQELFIDRGVVDLAFQKNLSPLWYLKVGWRFHSFHLRRVGDNPQFFLPIEGISNAFDSGLLSEIGFDNRDSAYTALKGHKALFQIYVPRADYGSRRSFERLLAYYEGYWPVATFFHLKTLSALCSVSEGAPFGWYSSLAGTIPFSGLRPSRYTDRSLLALGAEFHWRRWQPVTLFSYTNVGTVAAEASDLLRTEKKWGAGLGAEIYLTRFRARAFRVEAGRFGGEWTLNSMLGISVE